MLSQRLGAPSFFLLHSILLCECTTVFLIHSYIDGHLGCFQHLAIMNCAAVKNGVHRLFSMGVSGFLNTNTPIQERMARNIPSNEKMQTCAAAVESNMKFLQKTKNGTAFGPGNSTAWTIP